MTFSRYILKHQLVIGLSVIAALAIAVFSYVEVTDKTPASGRQLNSLTNTKINVVSASPQTLNAGSLASDVPPTAVSDQLQPQASSGTEASSAKTLQSNLNINDPAYANNTLVQSLLSGSQ